MWQHGRYLLIGGLAALALLLHGCGSTPVSSPVRDSGPRVHKDFSHLADAIPRHEPQTRAGNPPTYVVNGRRYTLLDRNDGYVERGYASWYGKKFHGRTTSNGEIYDMYAMTAAHKTLRIPAYVQVTNLRNGRQIVVRLNDRGPFVDNRIIDLSYAAASKLGFVQEGIAPVEVRIVKPGEPLPPAQLAQAVPVASPAETSPPPPAQTVAQPVASTASPALYLQLGSFVSRDNAEGLRSRLSEHNIDGVHIQQFNLDNQQVFRVRIGPLPSPNEADRLAMEINRLGMGAPRIVVD